MVYLLTFFAELLLLFLLSKTLTNLLFGFFYRSTRSKKITTYLMSILFLPGTLIHEIAHGFMATLLFVPVGKMELLPKLIGNNLRLGSIEIGRTDPVRRLLIGAGPFIFGVFILLGIFFYGARTQLFAEPLFIIVAGYVVFEIGNTMFSSKKDMEGALELLLASLAILLILYFLGIRLPAFDANLIFLNPIFPEVFKKANLYLTVPMGIDLLVIMLLRIFNRWFL